MKRYLGIFLAVTMALTMAACGPKAAETPAEKPAVADGATKEEAPKAEEPKAEEPKAEEPKEEAAAAGDDIMSPYGKYPEAITLTTARTIDPDPHFVEGETIENNAMTKLVKDKLNIDYKILWQVENTEFANKLSLNIASGDIPDMIALSTNDYLLYRQLVTNGMLADLTEGYEKCAGPYMKRVFGSFNEKNLETFKEDGKMYGIGGGRYGYEQELLWVRQDWLDTVGLPQPKTVQDIENVLKAFKEKKPGGKEHLGLPLDYQWAIDGYGSAYNGTPILLASGGAPKTWIKGADGKAIYGSITPENKEGLATLAKWYKEGLIDKQFMTRSASGAKEALVTGSETGLFFAPWWAVYGLSDLPHNDPKAELTPIAGPLDAKGGYNYLWPGPSGDFLVVSNKFSNPEAVVKILNVEYDAYRGLNKEEFKLIQPNLKNNVNWGTMMLTSWVNLEFADIIPAVGNLAKELVDTGTMVGNENTTDFDREMATAAKAYADTKSLEGTNWIHYNGRYKASNAVVVEGSNRIEPVFSYPTDSMAELKPNLDKLESEMYLKIITGEKPIDYFDEFVKEWKAQGGDIITAEVNSMLE